MEIALAVVALAAVAALLLWVLRLPVDEREADLAAPGAGNGAYLREHFEREA